MSIRFLVRLDQLSDLLDIIECSNKVPSIHYKLQEAKILVKNIKLGTLYIDDN